MLTLSLLSSLTETYKEFSHELPVLIILENTSKALLDTTVREMSDFLDDWIGKETASRELWEGKEIGSPGPSMATTTGSWLNTRVMDLEAPCVRTVRTYRQKSCALLGTLS